MVRTNNSRALMIALRKIFKLAPAHDSERRPPVSVTYLKIRLCLGKLRGKPSHMKVGGRRGDSRGRRLLWPAVDKASVAPASALGTRIRKIIELPEMSLLEPPILLSVQLSINF